MKRHEKKIGVIPQIAILFAIGILATGLVAFFSQQVRNDAKVRSQTESMSEQASDEVSRAIKEYPAYQWMLDYWYEHASELDIEYDADYSGNSVTERKAKELAEKYPDTQLKYATTEEVRKMEPADQKLYAEVTYSWFITRIDQIKAVYKMDFMFGAIPYDSYNRQFFLFSAADPGAVRGTEYGQVYPLGHTSALQEESQREGMIAAVEHRSHMAGAGDYVDDYVHVGYVDRKPLLLGITYNVSGLVSQVNGQTFLSTFIAIAYQVLLAILCMFLLFRYVIKPLRSVMENIREYADTKDSETVRKNMRGIRAENEIGQLADDFTDLSIEMDDYMNKIRNITAEKERIGAELEVANGIQASMLPNLFPAFPDRHEFDIYASMEAAKEVGGDFYDYFLVDDDHICLVIADVAGKGIPAALYMMASMIIIDNNAKSGISPAEILAETNEALCTNNREEMFVTVWLGILEISTGRLKAANAGHEYPVIKQGDGSFEMLKDKHGFVIGAMEGMTYKEYELQLEPGSKLFVYTDGVAEATDRNKNMFGTDRLLDSLNEDPDADPEQTLKNVRKRIDEFVDEEEQFDDLTMLCLQYYGNCASEDKANE